MTLVFVIMPLACGCAQAEPQKSHPRAANRFVTVKAQLPDSPPAELTEPWICGGGRQLLSLHLDQRRAMLDGVPVDEDTLRDVLRARSELAAELGQAGDSAGDLTIFVKAGVLKKRLRRFAAVARGAGYLVSVIVQSPTRW